MHTLIILENDYKIRGADPALGREQNFEYGLGGRVRYRLGISHVHHPPAGLDAFKFGKAYLASAQRIRRTIIDFADAISGPPPPPVDVVEFQLILIFHQTSQRIARTITRALEGLPQNQRWLNLPYQKIKAIRIRRVWLVSCESGIDQNPGISPLPFIDQASQMRIAAARGCTTERTPPPSDPAEYWKPSVYTFSTGDSASGGLIVNPRRVSFVRLPWENDGQGGIRPINPPPAGGHDVPTAGKVYKYDGEDLVEERTIPADGYVDLLADSF